MNPKLFAIIVMMTIIIIVLVFIFKQPYKKINEEQMQQSSIPVSYTHLDVYKRQAVLNPASKWKACHLMQNVVKE